jgi:type II secretory pathway pseudopilin PulG
MNCQLRFAETIAPVAGRGEAGYTLVALLALMTVLALFAMAVAPGIQHQAVREREQEAIFRGEQVVDAIAIYYRNRSATLRTRGDQALPTSMDQLLEGVPIPGAAKNRQILRPSAARDPLSADGEWRLIHPRSTALVDFQSAVMLFAGNIVPRPADPQILALQQFAAPQITSILNLGSTDRQNTTSADIDDSTGPFVGVATRNNGHSVLTYYGIEQHEQWIFTPLFRN